MPITKSAKKALRASKHKAVFNTNMRSGMKTAIKKFMGKPEESLLSKAFSTLDRAVKNNLLHRNTAARRKSRLSKLLQAAAGK